MLDRARLCFSPSSAVCLSFFFTNAILAEHSTHVYPELGTSGVASELAADSLNVGHAAASRIMRKDGGSIDGELQEQSIAIGSQGHFVGVSSGLQRMPVQAHSMLTLDEDDDTILPPKRRQIITKAHTQVVQEPVCEECVVTVQIATTNTPALSEGTKTPRVARKTMNIKACVNKEKPTDGFHFGGCTTSGDAGDICVHSENEQGGVRILKDKRGRHVGYGSCCSLESEDTVSQVSVMHCEPPPPQLNVKVGTPKQDALSIRSEEKQLSQDAIVAATEPEVVNSPGADLLNHTWGGIWDAWPENATSAEQGFVFFPQRLETIIMLLLCFSIAMVATVSSVWLMLWHGWFGSQITGSIFKLHPSTAAAIGLLWPIPIFSMLGFVTLMLPELAVVWQFLEALLVAATLRKMPELFLQTVGGQLHLELNHRAQDEATREALPIFSQWPFCCMRRCVRPKVPEFKDFGRFHWLVVLLCFCLPILSFSEMFFALEVVLGPPTTQIRLTNASPVIMTTIRCLQALCLSFGIGSVTGMEMVVTSLNPKASREMCVDLKSMYCQIFLGGIRLLPLVCSIAPLWGLGPLTEGHGAAASRGAIVSAAAVVCAVIAWRAFPVDKRHYLASPGSGNSEQSESASGKQGDMKPVLDQVKYCPFCGFSELQLEASQAMADCAVCPRCCAHNVPVHLVVRRGGQAPPTSKATSSAESSGH